MALDLSFLVSILSLCWFLLLLFHLTLPYLILSYLILSYLRLIFISSYVHLILLYPDFGPVWSGLASKIGHVS